MTKKKQIKYVPVVAKVSPDTKEWLEKIAAVNSRSISQQLRFMLGEARKDAL